MSVVIATRSDAEDTFRATGQATVVSPEIVAVERHLARHLRGRLRDARISLQQGGVVLHGRTRSYYVKQLAQHAVMKHFSLPIAANEIEVAPLAKGERQ